jgi:hypothetical protein
MQNTIKLGVYHHFKTGNLYKVIGVGKHSETLEDLVFYEALYENKVSKFWIRPLEMFTEKVIAPDGTKKKRFEFVSEK